LDQTWWLEVNGKSVSNDRPIILSLSVLVSLGGVQVSLSSGVVNFMIRKLSQGASDGN
jgi:hypothetical protein